MRKKSRNNLSIKSPLRVSIGVAITIGVSAFVTALVSAGVSNGVVGFDTSIWLVLFAQFVSVFLGVFVCQKIGKTDCVLDAAVVGCAYLCLLTLIAIVVFEGVSSATLFTAVSCLLGGAVGYLVAKVKFGALIRRRRKFMH